MGIKGTLADVRALCGGYTGYLVIYCANTPAQGAGCHHSADMPLLLAVALWGEDACLDDLPLKCSRCGSRKVDVRWDYPRGVGGKPLT